VNITTVDYWGMEAVSDNRNEGERVWALMMKHVGKPYVVMETWYCRDESVQLITCYAE